jgi:dTDP-4-dehydrorhamnose 3,5-epimerase
MQSTLIQGGIFNDMRGSLRFVNENNPGNFRRFYIITPSSSKIVRAWQGHKSEEKAFFAIQGSFIIAVVKPACFDEPADSETPELFELAETNNNLLRVPAGCYTGIKAREDKSMLLVLSNFDLAESKSDDYRQPPDKWVDWDSIV